MILRFLSPAFISLVVFGFFFTSNSKAQSSEALIADISNSFQAATTAVVALSSDDSVAAGTYKFKNPNSNDSELNLYKLVLELPFGDEQARVVPLVEFSPSYVDIEQDTEDTNLKIKNKSIGVGIGAHAYFAERHLRLTPRLKIEYSDIDSRFRSRFRDILDPTIVEILDADIQYWSYIPSLEALMHFNFSPSIRQFYNVTGSYIFNDASTASVGLGDFSDESWVLKNSLFAEILLSETSVSPKGVVRPIVSRVDVYGAAEEGLEFNNFYEFGIELVTAEFYPQYFREFGFGATYVYEKEVQGWRFGVVVKLS